MKELAAAVLQVVCAALSLTLMLPMLATAWAIHRPNPCGSTLHTAFCCLHSGPKPLICGQPGS